MPSLAAQLTEYMEQAFAALGLPVEHARVSVSAPGQNAQFQCNGAMACARVAGKNPRDLAQGIIDALGQHGDVFAQMSVGGPGFINITLQDGYIARFLGDLSGDVRAGVRDHGQGCEVILDYGGPNIAKPMHVGHLRSSIIGDTLRRVYLFAGYKAIGDVHMGDWGTPMGMILSELEEMGFEGVPDMEMLAEIYPKASAACKADEARMARAREATRKLQDGDVEYTRKWRGFIDVSVAGMKANFAALGVQFDEWKGESDAHPYIADMVADLKDRGIAVVDDGALIIPVEREGDNKTIPPFIVLKSDGAVLYSTTDLATLIERMQSHNPAKIVYVVDQRQHLHFEQVFRAARLAGIVPDEVELVFAGFGTMNGHDGKPFKTRAGGVMRLDDLIGMAVEKAMRRLDEADLARDIDEGERGVIAQKVGLAAVKFADLQNNRITDYVFDLDRMTLFEGKTGPYLLYQAVRIQSLLRKAEFQNFRISKSQNLKISEEDRDLALMLCGFADHFDGALRGHAPHILCAYAYDLAQAFSSFYARCHILSEEDEAVKASRLFLCAQTHRQLVLILELLGIGVPERM